MSWKILAMLLAFSATACSQASDGKADNDNVAESGGTTESGASESFEGDPEASENPSSNAPNGNLVAPDNGHITVSGKLTNEGVECPAMRGSDGKLYTLTGDLGGFKSGDSVTVTGTWAEFSFCQQGKTINVASIARAT